MEQEQNPSLFGLNIDASSKSFLAETARWGKFLAIIGFIFCGIIIIAGIIVASNTSEISKAFNRYGDESPFKSLGMALAVIYILGALIYFFPCLFLLRFSNHMKTALATDDQVNLNTSFRNLKSLFKFVGICTIIFISFYILLAIFGRLGSTFG